MYVFLLFLLGDFWLRLKKSSSSSMSPAFLWELLHIVALISEGAFGSGPHALEVFDDRCLGMDSIVTESSRSNIFLFLRGGASPKSESGDSSLLESSGGRKISSSGVGCLAAADSFFKPGCNGGPFQSLALKPIFLAPIVESADAVDIFDLGAEQWCDSLDRLEN